MVTGCPSFVQSQVFYFLGSGSATFSRNALCRLREVGAGLCGGCIYIVERNYTGFANRMAVAPPGRLFLGTSKEIL